MPKRSSGSGAMRQLPTWHRLLALLPFLIALTGCDEISAEQRIENAQAFMQQGAPHLAIAELKHALQEAPDDARLRLMLGKLCLSGGDLPYADKELSRARALGLESPDLMLAQGELWLRQQRPERLLDELVPGPGWPDDAQAAALGLRARASLSLDDLAGARGAYQALLELHPDSVAARGVGHRTVLREPAGPGSRAAEKVRTFVATRLVGLR